MMHTRCVWCCVHAQQTMRQSIQGRPDLRSDAPPEVERRPVRPYAVAMLAFSCVETLLACAANLLPASRADSARFLRLNALLNAMSPRSAEQQEDPSGRGGWGGGGGGDGQATEARLQRHTLMRKGVSTKQHVSIVPHDGRNRHSRSRPTVRRVKHRAALDWRSG